MNKRVELLVVNHIDRFIKKCIDNNIYLFDIEYINYKTIKVKCFYKDIKSIKRLNYYCDIKINKFLDIYDLFNVIKSNYIVFLIGILSFILINIISLFIVDIEINYKSKALVELISRELINHDIYKYQLRKSFFKLDSISKDVIKNNSDKIEWLSIKRVGMRYVVDVQERIISAKKDSYGCRNIITKYDALITKVKVDSGNVLVRSGDYVKKGDILVDSNILLNDNIKGCVSSNGEVYGNVWLNINIVVPVNNEVKSYTGNKRNNYLINNKKLFKDKYNLFDSEISKSYKILGISFKVVSEKEFNYVLKEYSDEEINHYIDSEIINKYKNAEIVYKKVLNKVQNNDTISYRIFVVVNTQIGEYANINGDD